MPLVDLEIAPGVVTERTERGAKGHWRDCNRVRFRQGLPEKIGGCQESDLAGDTIIGVPRGALDWAAIDADKITAVGTDKKLYQINGSTVTNITPYRLFTDEYGGSDTELTDPFDTTDMSAEVNVSHTSHGLTVGTTVYFANATAVGGITIDGEYTVTEVIGSNDYTITHSSAATSTATGGGTVDYAYEINIGVATAIFGLGWGVGTWGSGTWGTPRTTESVLQHARIWSLDTWGEDLIANPRGGSIYLWDKSTGYASTNKAALISNAPSECTFAIMSPVDRHLIALGCTPVGGSGLDPLTIRVCSQNDFTDWTPGRTNTSIARRLDGASRILSGLRVREEILVFTDLSLYAMTFVGPPAVFNIRQIGSGCGLVGPLARAEFGGTAFWMSYEDLFYYDGSLGVLPCPIRNHIFDDINRTASSQFFTSVNTLFQEVWFWWASAAATEIDRYAAFNVLERSWYFGEWDRTAWLDQSSVRSTPAAFDASGVLYDHESGASDNGAAMGEYVESWDVEVPGPNGAPPGDNLQFIRRVVPDFLRMTAPINVTLKARKYPHAEQVTKGPFNVLTSDGYIRPRIRGRQVSLRMESDQDFPNADWRAGTWRVDVRPHGRR